MSFDYNNLLRRQIYQLKNSLTDFDYNFVIDKEQSFNKDQDLDPNTIYVLTKNLENELSVGVDNQPVQILILTEQDSLDIAKEFFTTFAKNHNFETFMDDHTFVKQQYMEPVILSNFNVVDYGYRSVLYMSVNLIIMENVVDLNELYIDNVKYQALTWDMSYSMTPNTQSLAQTINLDPSVEIKQDYIAKSVKSISTFAINITIPVVASALITKVLDIIDEDDPPVDTDDLLFGGNEDFEFDFNLGTKNITKTMKLVAVQFGTAINNIPVIRLGFMK